MAEIEFYQHKNGVRGAVFPFLAQRGLRHAISTRIGGNSQGDLGTLNLGIKSGDIKENVIVNRQLFCETIDIKPERVVSSGQVHGCRIAVVDDGNAGQRMADTDALVTGTPGLGLLLFFADCVPLLIFDPKRRVIGLSHAGWRGTHLSIGPRTLAVMQHTFGTDPEDCLVGIGPSIGPDDYEIDRPVMDEIRTLWSKPEKFSQYHGEGHWLLDLWGWNRNQFEDAGVQPENIRISGISTMRQAEMFYSHRASKGRAGRFGVLMSL